MLIAGTTGGEDLLRDNVIALYTQDTWLYRIANRLLRGTSEPGEERLWPFVSIMQMSLIRARPKENDGGVVYRGGVIPGGSLPTGRWKFVMRGFTSCSRIESRAFEFASRAAPERVQVASTASVRAMFEIKLPHVKFEQAHLGSLWVGAAVNIRHHAGDFEGEEEVVLLDGTTLTVTGVTQDSTNPFDNTKTPAYSVPCVQIHAEVDWDATAQYFKIFNADERESLGSQCDGELKA
jgi:hypothetical protein